jgi:hypothetical protein
LALFTAVTRLINYQRERWAGEQKLADLIRNYSNNNILYYIIDDDDDDYECDPVHEHGSQGG